MHLHRILEYLVRYALLLDELAVVPVVGECQLRPILFTLSGGLLGGCPVDGYSRLYPFLVELRLLYQLLQELLRVCTLPFLQLSSDEILESAPLLNLMLAEALEVDDFHSVLLGPLLQNVVMLVGLQQVVLVDVELRVLLLNVSGGALAMLQQLQPSGPHIVFPRLYLAAADNLDWVPD